MTDEEAIIILNNEEESEITDESNEETDSVTEPLVEPEKILTYLDNFIIVDNQADCPADDTYNKSITTNELNEFYQTAITYTISYLDLNASDEINTILMPFVYMWAAGLIYKKYDIRPNDLIDETLPLGYGDQLIISAKMGLKPYKKYSFTAW